MNQILTKLKSRRLEKEDYLVLILVAVFLIMTILKPDRFLSAMNLDTMGRQFAELGIFALGMMIVIVTGGMDLSIVATSALSGIIGAFVLRSMNNPEYTMAQTAGSFAVAILVMLAVGFIAGLLNGVLVAVIGLHPVLATLGTQTLFNGISLLLSRGAAISGFSPLYMKIGNGSIGFLPIPTLIFVVISVICYLLYEKTVWGRSVYMLGNNPRATNFSGVNTVWVNLRVYLCSGLLAACAAVIMVSRYNSAKMDYGASYLLQCIAVAVLGGTDILGGYGKVKGTVIAVCIMQMLSTGFNLLGVDRFVVNMITGIVLISVLLFNAYLARKRSNAKKGTND